MEITVGMRAKAEMTVTDDFTAVAAGSGSLRVFGTPYMAALMEKAAVKALEPAMDEGSTSVGTRLEISHTAATPVGMKVWAEATVTSVDGRSVGFEVTAWDEKGKIGSGNHTRFVVNGARFTEKTYSKLG